MVRGKILVVDNDALCLKIVRVRLERAGFEVLTRDANEGTTYLIFEVLKIRPDVILMDVRMPLIWGDQITKILRANDSTRQIPIILLSSDSLLDLQHRAAQCGAIGGVVKTSDDDFFVRQFERLFERSARMSRN